MHRDDATRVIPLAFLELRGVSPAQVCQSPGWAVGSIHDQLLPQRTASGVASVARELSTQVHSRRVEHEALIDHLPSTCVPECVCTSGATVAASSVLLPLNYVP